MSQEAETYVGQLLGTYPDNHGTQSVRMVIDKTNGRNPDGFIKEVIGDNGALSRLVNRANAHYHNPTVKIYLKEQYGFNEVTEQVLKEELVLLLTYYRGALSLKPATISTLGDLMTRRPEGWENRFEEIYTIERWEHQTRKRLPSVGAIFHFLGRLGK